MVFNIFKETFFDPLNVARYDDMYRSNSDIKLFLMKIGLIDSPLRIIILLPFVFEQNSPKPGSVYDRYSRDERAEFFHEKFEITMELHRSSADLLANLEIQQLGS